MARPRGVVLAWEAMVELEYAHRSVTGPVRAGNEDVIGCSEPEDAADAAARGWLFALADGVGGAAAGRVAARAAVEVLTGRYRTGAGGEEPAARLERLVREANHHIVDLAQALRAGRMATTLVACVIRGAEATIAHAGDSRCYLLRDGHAHSLTRDHLRRRRSWLPWRRAPDPVLVRSLGADLFVRPALRRQKLCAGDVLALTSDGLHVSLGGADLARVVRPAKGLEAAAEELVALAAERDGRDNISVVLIRIVRSGPRGSEPQLAR
jgi:serine/threonine protein phosphatase PrpC